MIVFSSVNNVRTTEFHRYEEETFDSLLDKFFDGAPAVVHSLAERDEAPLLLGWELKPWGEAVKKTNALGREQYSRCHANCVAMHFLMLDVDNSPKLPTPKISWDEAVAKLAGTSALLYSSYNDRNPDKDGGVDKFRLVIELTRPIPIERYQDVHDLDRPCIGGALQRLYPWAARESFKPSQPFYSPIADAQRLHLFRVQRLRGSPLDWEALTPERMEAAVGANGVALAAAHAPALQTADANTLIRLTSGRTTTVGALYHELSEGYSHRRPCFSTLRSEKQASSYAYRDGRYLVMQDFGAIRQQVRYEIVPRQTNRQLWIDAIKAKRGAK